VQLRTGGAAVEEKRLKLKNKRRERAAQLLAEDLRSDLKISELCGIHIATLYNWKKRPEIVERIEELTQIYADKALKTGLAQRDKRVAVLRQMHDKLLQIVEERAADPRLESGPGGKTGLVVRAVKVIGKQVHETFVTDTKLVKELRETGEQIARELGQWQERIEVEDACLAEIMAKARQRKPEPAQEPIDVIEVEHEIAPGEWPN
jgi:hypothetical protein